MQRPQGREPGSHARNTRPCADARRSKRATLDCRVTPTRLCERAGRSRASSALGSSRMGTSTLKAIAARQWQYLRLHDCGCLTWVMALVILEDFALHNRACSLENGASQHVRGLRRRESRRWPMKAWCSRASTRPQSEARRGLIAAGAGSCPRPPLFPTWTADGRRSSAGLQ